MRLDVALNRLCLTRSRSEAKGACDAGAILVGGRPAKPSQIVAPGDIVTLLFVNHHVEVRLLDLPRASISKKAARDLYEVVREERMPRP